MQAINTLSVKTFDVGPMLNIVYLIWDNNTKEAAIVDPAWDLTEVLNFIDKKKLTLRKILLTHSHHDHVNSIDIVLKKYDIPIYINKLEPHPIKKAKTKIERTHIVPIPKKSDRPPQTPQSFLSFLDL